MFPDSNVSYAANTTYPPRNGAIAANPSTLDNLLPNRYRFVLKRAPNVNFWVQSVVIPGFSISPVGYPNPFVNIPQSGDHIEYESLGISMLVDNQMANYFEIYCWLKSLGFPNRFEEYADLLGHPAVMDDGLKSEISLFILNGQQQPRLQFIFHDAFPVAIGRLEFSSTNQALDRTTCNVEFKYTSYSIKRING